MITRPGQAALTAYIKNYIDKAGGTDLIQSLQTMLEKNLALYNSIGPGMEDYRYADGKWTIKDVLTHVVDTERIFSYRALAIGRGETISLPGYDQDAYALHSNASGRKLADIIGEYEAVRKATILLFEGFTEAMLDTPGIANNLSLTPRIIGWMIPGHDSHHHHILGERYSLAFSRQ